MQKIITSLIGIFLLTGISSCGSSDTDSKKEADSTNTAKIDSAKKADTIASRNSHLADLKPDAEFAVNAADGGKMEVELGKLAKKNGASIHIKQLGALMVKDHSAANKELEIVAREKNITLPTELSEKCQKKLADLSAKTGADFDKAYADLMVDDHKDDLDEFKKEAEKGNDSELSAWAKSKVPVLEHHLSMAETAKNAVNK